MSSISMKSAFFGTLCALAFAALPGCLAAPDDSDPEATSQDDVGADEDDENVGEAEQALDSNCQARSCVSCGINGQYKVRTETWKKVYANGTYTCQAPITVTYGACSNVCSY
jgi:hypothetical protein